MKYYYTLSEVSEMLKVSKRTLYRWIDAGKLPAVKIGSSWKVEGNALEAFLTALEEEEQ